MENLITLSFTLTEPGATWILIEFYTINFEKYLDVTMHREANSGDRFPCTLDS